jgi:hypothetical protein
MRSDAFEKGALPVADAVEFSARLVAALSEAGDLTPEWRGPFEKVGSVAGAAAVGGAVGGDLGLHIVRGWLRSPVGRRWPRTNSPGRLGPLQGCGGFASFRAFSSWAIAHSPPRQSLTCEQLGVVHTACADFPSLDQPIGECTTGDPLPTGQRG